MEPHATNARAHLPSHWPFSLWWKLIRYGETLGHCDIRISTVDLSLGTHLPTAFVWDRAQASGFVMRRTNHSTTELMLMNEEEDVR